MAVSFDVNAKLKFQGPSNLRSTVTKVQTAFSSIKTNVVIQTASASKTVNAVSKAVSALNANLIEIAPAAASASNSLKSLSTIGKLNLQINTARSASSLTTLTRAVNAFDSSLTRALPNVRSFNNALGRMSNTIHGVKGNFSQLAGSAQTISTAVNSVDKSTKTAIKSTGTWSELLGETTRRFGAFGIIAAAVSTSVLLIKKSIGEALQFDREMIRVKQVTGETDVQLSSLSKTVTDLSTRLGTSSLALLKSATTLRQAGLSATDTKDALKILAETQLTPNFEDLEKTTEGLIAIRSQFKNINGNTRGAKELSKDFDAINKSSAQFAFESGDIINAVIKAGGAFSSAGGNLQEFVATMGAIRSTTRETADTIATGIKTISARIQRPVTQQRLKIKYGIDLQDDNGNFVGITKAQKILDEATKNLGGRDPRFANILEEVGGVRQLSKTIPFIREAALAQEIYNSQLNSTDSITKNAVTAQQALLVQVTKLQEKFHELFRTILESNGFRSLIGVLYTTTDLILNLTKAMGPLAGLFASLGTARLALGAGAGVAKGLSGIFGIGIGGSLGNKVVASAGNFFKGLQRKAKGGIVPGTGDSDTVPAYLQAGSFVINKKSTKALANSLLTPGELVLTPQEAKKIGYGKLQHLNKYDQGGFVDDDETKKHITVSHTGDSETVFNPHHIPDPIDPNELLPIPQKQTEKDDRHTKERKFKAKYLRARRHRMNEGDIAPSTTDLINELSSKGTVPENARSLGQEAVRNINDKLSSLKKRTAEQLEISQRQKDEAAKRLSKDPYFRTGMKDMGPIETASARKYANVGIGQEADLINKKFSKSFGDNEEYQNIKRGKIVSSIRNSVEAAKLIPKPITQPQLEQDIPFSFTDQSPPSPPQHINEGARFTAGKEGVSEDFKLTPLPEKKVSNRFDTTDYHYGRMARRQAQEAKNKQAFIDKTLGTNQKSQLALPSPLEAQRINGAIPLGTTFSPNPARLGKDSPDNIFSSKIQEINPDLEARINAQNAAKNAQVDIERKRQEKITSFRGTKKRNTINGEPISFSPFISRDHSEPLGIPTTAEEYMKSREDENGYALDTEPKSAPRRNIRSRLSNLFSRNVTKEKSSGIFGLFKKSPTASDNTNQSSPINSAIVNATSPINKSPANKECCCCEGGANRGTGGGISDLLQSSGIKTPAWVDKLTSKIASKTGLAEGGRFSSIGSALGKGGSLLSKGAGLLKSPLGLAAGAIAPVAANYLTGGAEAVASGTTDKTFAQGASVAGGAVAGAASGAAFGSVIPGIGTALGGLAGAIAGAASGLEIFNKQLDDLKIKQLGEDIDKTLTDIEAGKNLINPDKFKSNISGLTEGIKKTTTNGINEDSGLGAFISPTAISSALIPAFKAAGNGLANFVSGGRIGSGFNESLNNSSDEQVKANQSAQRDAAAPEFTRISTILANQISKTGKTSSQLEKEDPTAKALIDALKQLSVYVNQDDINKSRDELSIANKTASEATARANDAKRVATAESILLDKTNNLISGFDKLAEGIDLSINKLDKNFAIQSISHDSFNGKISHGTNLADVGALGSAGAELKNFSKQGGGFDQAKESLRKAFSSAGQGNDTDLTNNVLDKIDGIGGPAKGFEGALGGQLKDIVKTHLSAKGGETIRKFNTGDQEGAIDDVLGKIGKDLQTKGEKASAQITKAMEMFGKASIEIAQQTNEINEQRAKSNEIAFDRNKNNRDTNIQLSDGGTDSRGNFISKEQLSANSASKFANERFNSDQTIRFGVSSGHAQDAEHIGKQLDFSQDKLRGAIINQRNAQRDNKPLKEQESAADNVVKASSEVANLVDALKNLANSTELVSAAQGKLNVAIDAELSDKNARRNDAETLTFGSAKDRMQLFRTQQLQNIAAQQGNLNGFSDKDKQAVLARLKENGGQVNSQQQFDRYGRARGVKRYTNNQLYEQLIGQNTRPSELEQSTDENGNRSSRAVATAKREVNQAYQNRQNAQNALIDFNKKDRATKENELQGNKDRFNKNINAAVPDFGPFEKAVAVLDKVSNDSELINALKSFPESLKLEQNGTIKVVINGAEVLASIKGDLGNEITARVMSQIQEKLPQMLKNVPA